MKKLDLTNEILNDNSLYEMYKQKANDINKKEEFFRNNTRKRFHPEWKIFRRRVRKWITLSGVFYLNITEYETIDKETNKLKRFVFHHHKIIKNLEFSKFDFEVIKKVIGDYLNGNKRSEYPKFFPSRQMISHFVKRLNIQQYFVDKNNELLEEIVAKNNENKDLKFDIEIDDLFKNFQLNKSKENLRIRQAIFHKKNSIKTQGLCVFFAKPLKEKTNENNDLNYQINKLQNTIEMLNIQSKNITINGDGATWMKTINKGINSKYVLDFFHIKKAINSTFGYNRFASKQNKEIFKYWKSNEFGDRWSDLFNAVFEYRTIKEYDNLKNAFLIESKEKTIPKKIILNARKFFKYINSNKNFIWNDDGKLIRNKSYTEHFVYHHFKKYINKHHSLYSFDSIKTIVIYNNLRKNFATIFA